MAKSAPEYPNTPPSDRQDGNDPQRPVVETTTEARQAVSGQGNGVVLAISTLSVILAFGLIYAFFFSA